MAGYFMRKRNIDLLGFTLAMISLILMVTACCFQSKSWLPWRSCGKSSDCQAWQAFLCLSIIFMFLGFMLDRARKFSDVFSDANQAHLITGVLWFIGGLFEIVALSVYTAWANKTYIGTSYPATYALGWVAAILGLLSGLVFIYHSRK